jgi:hypothetical protein
MKYKRFTISILVIGIFLPTLLFSFSIKKAYAACNMDLTFQVQNGSNTSTYRGTNSIPNSAGNAYSLNFSIKECQSAVSRKVYKLEAMFGGNTASLLEGTIESSTPNINNQNFSLGNAATGSVYLYTLTLKEVNGSDALPPETVEVTFTAPTPSPPGTTPTPAIGTPTPIGQIPPQNPPVSVDIPKIDNPTKAANLAELISKAINILLSVIAMVSVIMIIVSGFRMVAYGGNPAELGKAKAGLIWAILGLVIAVMSFSIVSIITRLIR